GRPAARPGGLTQRTAHPAPPPAQSGTRCRHLVPLCAPGPRFVPLCGRTWCGSTGWGARENPGRPRGRRCHDDHVTVQIRRLDAARAGEVLTLQRAAYVSEARLYHDPELPPLVQPLDELRAELERPDVIALGAWEEGLLVGSVRLRIDGAVAHLGRLVVAPDRQGRGIGSSLLSACERMLPPWVGEIRLFTGSRSAGNI